MHARRQAGRQVQERLVTTDPLVPEPVARSEDLHNTISALSRFEERPHHVLYPLELADSRKSVGAAANGPDPVIWSQQQHEHPRPSRVRLLISIGASLFKFSFQVARLKFQSLAS